MEMRVVKHRNKINPNWSYAAAFDEAMSAHFGEQFTTEYNILAGAYGGYQTVRNNGKKMTQAMAKVGRTISQAIELGLGAYE